MPLTAADPSSPRCDVAKPLKASDWKIIPGVPVAEARRLCQQWHYSRGGSNTATDVHGLVRVDDPLRLWGVAWWLPPTRVAAESVHEDWKRVVSLTRLVIDPDAPRNAASFLLGRSLRILRREGRWVAVVTYADESQGHTGAIYRASNWTYVGRTGPYPRWLDGDGKQVAPKATVSRTKAEMEALGYHIEGRYHKHKFVMMLGN